MSLRQQPDAAPNLTNGADQPLIEQLDALGISVWESVFA